MTHPHRKMIRITTNEEILLIRRMAIQAVNVEQKPDSNWQVTVHTGEKGLGPFALTVRTREEAEAILALLEDDPVPANDGSRDVEEAAAPYTFFPPGKVW